MSVDPRVYIFYNIVKQGKLMWIQYGTHTASTYIFFMKICAKFINQMSVNSQYPSRRKGDEKERVQLWYYTML